MEYRDLNNSELDQFVDFSNHELIRRFEDTKTGLVAFTALHNTNLGPALGGCRMFNYSSEEEAVRDVLRLSKGMTYKNALANLPLGGGKSVILGDPFSKKTPEMMEAMGRAIETLGGKYITAEDSGTNEKDMELMSLHTNSVVGLPFEADLSPEKLGGDPSPLTAYGVYSGIKAAVRKRYGDNKLAGLKVAIQGIGSVGFELAKLLNSEGVEIITTDVRQEGLDRAQQELHDLKIVAPEDIFSVSANIFAPCALGAQINDITIPNLKVDIVAGAANNQLAEAHHEIELQKRNILYAPDYIINSGGVISVAYEYFLRTHNNPFDYKLTSLNMLAHVKQIGDTLDKVYKLADERSCTPGQAADQLAESIFLSPALKNNNNNSDQSLAASN